MPLSVGRFGSQGVAQCGRRAPLVAGLADHLCFLEHVHEVDANQSVVGCRKRFDPYHGPGHPLDTSMLLLHDSVEGLHLPAAEGGAVCLVVALERGFMGVAAVQRARLRPPVAAARLFEKAQRCLVVPLLGAQNVNSRAVLVDRALALAPLPLHLHGRLLQAPTGPDGPLAPVQGFRALGTLVEHPPGHRGGVHQAERCQSR